MADAAGVGCMMGCMLESKVGITAAAACLPARPSSPRTTSTRPTSWLPTVRGGITYDKDHLVVPDAPGLGITAIEGWQPLKD